MDDKKFEMEMQESKIDEEFDFGEKTAKMGDQGFDSGEKTAKTGDQGFHSGEKTAKMGDEGLETGDKTLKRQDTTLERRDSVTSLEMGESTLRRQGSTLRRQERTLKRGDSNTTLMGADEILEMEERALRMRAKQSMMDDTPSTVEDELRSLNYTVELQCIELKKMCQRMHFICQKTREMQDVQMGTLQEVAQSFRVTHDVQDAQRRQQMEMLQELRTIEQNTREGMTKMTWFKQRPGHDVASVDVYVRASVVSVGDIDTVKQQFVCEFYLSLRWEEPNLAHMLGREDEIDWREQWEPGMYFVDLINIEKYERDEKLRPPKSKGGPPEVMFYYRIRGTFKEMLDISRFPFDYQTLTLTMTTSWKRELVKLKKDYDREDNIRTWNFTGKHDWNLQSHVLTESTFTEEEQGASDNVFPIYKIEMHALRKYAYFLYNVALIIDFITALSFSAYAIDAGSPGDRIGISLTLLLTSVAMKYVTNTFVPQVSYLTLLDKFIICCMAFQFLMAGQNIASSFINSRHKSSLKIFEWVSFGTLLGIFVLIHLVFGGFWLSYTSSNKRKMAEHEKANKEMKKKVQENKSVYEFTPSPPEEEDGPQQHTLPAKYLQSVVNNI